MRVKSKWIEARMSVITDERGHNAVVDIEKEKNGTNSSYSALEMCLMSLAGSITTIYSMIADDKKVSLYDMIVDIEAELDKETINYIHITADILTSASIDNAKKVFDDTIKACPVSILFGRAGVVIDYTVEIHQTGK